MLNLNSIMIGTKQSARMAEFYTALLGSPPGMSDPEHGFHGWQLGALNFSILDHSEMGGKTKDPGRLIINFETKEVTVEFERAKGIGATVIREPYEMGGGWIATLADPDGNYFQFVTPM